jgi:hypothetical protein
LPEIDGCYQPEIIPFYIEYNPVICNDGRIAIDGFQFVEIPEIPL